MAAIIVVTIIIVIIVIATNYKSASSEPSSSNTKANAKQKVTLPTAENKHYYIIDGTNFAKSITTNEIDVLLDGDEATSLLNFLNTVKNQGHTSFTLDSPQMYIDIIVDMFLQDLAMGIAEATKAGSSKIKMGQSYEEIMVLLLFYQDAYENDEYMNTNPTATKLLNHLGESFAGFSQMIGIC